MRLSEGQLWLSSLTALGLSLCIFTAPIAIHLTVFGRLIQFPACTVIFSLLTFPVTDIITEVYGREAAKTTVWIGLLSQLITVIVIELLCHLPGETAVFESFRSHGPWVLIASVCAYLSSQYLDIWVFTLIKERLTGDRHLWLRNNLSTCVSQALNSTIFLTCVFGPSQASTMLLPTLGIKWIAAAVDTPLVYLGCYLLRDCKLSPSLAQ